ncbi:MAG: urea ABC transporter substrate-binding protein [Candidatus Binatia bacterium]
MNKKIPVVLLVVLLAVVGWLFYGVAGKIDTEPIKVGILHSLTGTMSISEKSVVDATLLAIEEINAKGGILGRKIEAIVSDGKSDWPTFAKEAERLIAQERVSVVFGCWTSASRKTVKPIFEKYNHLLFYPLQYEGLEQSPNIVYTGAAPNQQIIPAVKWAFDNLGKRFFLVASDYVFPHSANEIIKAQVVALGGQIVGEEYLILGSQYATRVVNKIVSAQPHVILNTINGHTNVAFFAELRKAGVTPDKIPTLSFSIAENELRGMNPKAMAGDYAAWNYFQSLDTPENREFVRRFQGKFGADRVTNDPMEAAYIAVHLWGQAVQDAREVATNAVRKAILDQSFNAPEGIVHLDPETQHLWKTVRIGKIRPDGQFDIVWTSESPIRPTPYPPYRSKAEWEKFLQDLYQGWGQSWANPG